MNRDCFAFQMRRLTDTFGAANYPKPRVEEIFAECHDLTDDQFAYLITRMIREKAVKYPPLLPIFKEFADAIRKDMIDRPKNEAAALPDRHGPPKKYETADEAFKEVNEFYRLLYQNRPDAKEFDRRFREFGQQSFPKMYENVESLRSLVKSGSIDARAEFVAASKQYMLKVAVQLTFSSIGVMPETSEGA